MVGLEGWGGEALGGGDDAPQWAMTLRHTMASGTQLAHRQYGHKRANGAKLLRWQDIVSKKEEGREDKAQAVCPNRGGAMKKVIT